jgi:hypothetical protein
MVSALDGERLAHGSQKVSEFQYCKLKQGQQKTQKKNPETEIVTALVTTLLKMEV